MPTGVGGGTLSNPPVKPDEGSLWAFIGGAWQQSHVITAPLSIDLGTGALPSTGNGDQLMLSAPDSGAVSVGVLAFNSVGTFTGYRADGTRASKVAPGIGSQLYSTLGYAWDGSAFGLCAGMTIRCVNSPTTGDHGGAVTFRACASGSTSLAEVGRFTQNLLIGTTTDITGTGGCKIAGITNATAANTGAFQCLGGGYIAGDLVLGGVYRIGTTQVVGAQIAGYGTPTGGARQSSFAAGAITLPNLAAAVAQLIVDLKTHGLLAA